MKNNIYKILWIDDEHETLTGTKGRAKRNGINLVPFKSLNGGMSELERNYSSYDGVLLDAKFFENEDDVSGSEDTDYVHRAKEQLLQMNKIFEVFVLTGQAEAYADKTFNKVFTNVYNKGSDDEMDRLFTDIKNAADSQEDTQLRHAYKRVFDLCTDKYIGQHVGQDLLNLLKVDNESDIHNHFNAVRKIIEDLFRAFHKFKLLPDEFIQPSVALNPSCKFLSGLEQDDKTNPIYKQYHHFEETHLPRQITYYLKSILYVVQDGSHRSNIDDHVQRLKTPYLFKSVLYQLLDVLVWFKMYIDSIPQKENWEKKDSEDSFMRSGKVINYNTERGFAFFEPDDREKNAFIPPYLVSNHSLQNDMKIWAEIEEYTDNRSGEIKIRVKKIEKSQI